MPVVGEVARRCSREGVLGGARGRVPRGVLGGPAPALKVAGVPEKDARQRRLLFFVLEPLRLVPEPELELGRELVVEAVVAACVDAMLFRSCVCSMAWSFYAIDATLSP